MSKDNWDENTVRGFGEEWSRFPQESLLARDRDSMFADYFWIFPWDRLDASTAVGADLGCGSGRWAKLVAPRVKHLHLIDASGDALAIARHNLRDFRNVTFHQASVDGAPLENASLDFAYCLGVLHHVPDTAGAIARIAPKLKAGAPFLVYLYYAFDHRPVWFRALWRLSDSIRRPISRMPFRVRYALSQVIALGVYWPLARVACLLDRSGWLPRNWPLAYYRDKGFYVMRTDALDRFGTRLEQRFACKEIRKMLEDGGFMRIRFSDRPPHWVAIAEKR